MSYTSPLVSVLMTAYNREQYIAEAIESVLMSTYSNFELIIVDDGSKDKTVQIAKEYQLKDKRIRFYENQINLGDYPNRNKAASYAKGDYLMYVDSDDKTFPDSIQYCVQTMLDNPIADMAMIYLNENIKTPKLISSKESIHNHFFKKPFLMMGPGGTFLKREFFEKLNRYPTKYGPANDMYFNLMAANAGNLILVPYIFVFYRRHEGQEINNKYSYLSNNYNYLRDAMEEIPFSMTDDEKKYVQNKNKRRFFVSLTKYFFKTFNVVKVREVLKKTSFGMNDVLTAIFQK